MALRMVNKIYVGNVEEENTETSTNSSTGSNCVEKQHEDSSNPPNKIVGYFFKPSDVKYPQNQEIIGPYDSTAESALSTTEVNYAPMMIYNELCKYKLDRDTYTKTYVLLASDDKELDLLLGVPPKFRMAWIMKRVHKDGVDVNECLLKIKKRKEFDVGEEPLKKKRAV